MKIASLNHSVAQDMFPNIVNPDRKCESKTKTRSDSNESIQPKQKLNEFSSKIKENRKQKIIRKSAKKTRRLKIYS